MPLELAVIRYVWLAPDWKLSGGLQTFGLVAWASTATTKENRAIGDFIAADCQIDLL
jgi:hypothetical protein